MYAELQNEAQKYPYSIPDEWIRDKFQELYLEAYIQNFTLNNPLKEKMVDLTFFTRFKHFFLLICPIIGHSFLL